jgi:peroxiredoxin
MAVSAESRVQIDRATRFHRHYRSTCGHYLRFHLAHVDSRCVGRPNTGSRIDAVYLRPETSGIMTRTMASTTYGVWLATALCLGALVVLQSWERKSDKPDRPTAEARVEVGRPGPVFQLSSVDDTTYNLASFRGRPVLLFFLCGCASCRQAARALSRGDWHSTTDLVIMGITALGPGDAHAFCHQTRFRYPVLLDTQGKTALAYRVQNCPVFWLLDSAGIARRVAHFDLAGKHRREQLLSWLGDALAQSANPLLLWRTRGKSS